MNALLTYERLKDTHLDVDVQKASLHHLEGKAHLHAGADAVEIALFCVRVHAGEVAVDLWTQPHAHREQN